MRIACIHIPQFALQSATRVDPALRGAAVAVVSGVLPGREAAGVLHAPIVLACSRLAWAHGVRIGMTATAARLRAPEIRIVTADAANERETLRAIGDALLAITPAVDLGGRVGGGGAHLAMYAEVPAKTRGAAFGERLVELVDALGLTARIGIADDRFTAWVAASQGAPLKDAPGGAAGSEERDVIVVPRGGSAAFLAPRPLSLLAISPEVQHMLEALGVRTLGEFAALPAPSVARPFEADYQALARGESDATLRPYVAETAIREEVTVSGRAGLELQDLLPAGEHAGGPSLPAAVALVAHRIALRLEGRGRGAARLDITAIAEDGVHELPLTLDHAIDDAEELAHTITPALETVAATQAEAGNAWRLRVVVAGEMVLGGETTEIFAEGSRPHTVRGDQPAAQTIDPVAMVLSSSGSLFALSAPSLRAERRDAHRRTRRGKQRRARSGAQAQPHLFDRVTSKA